MNKRRRRRQGGKADDDADDFTTVEIGDLPVVKIAWFQLRRADGLATNNRQQQRGSYETGLTHDRPATICGVVAGSNE